MKTLVFLLCSSILAATGMANPFFAFDNGLGRGLQPTKQAALLKALGYDGIGCQNVRSPCLLCID